MNDRPKLQFSLRRMLIFTALMAGACAGLRLMPSGAAMAVVVIFAPTWVPVMLWVLFDGSQACRSDYLTTSMHGEMPVLIGLVILCVGGFYHMDDRNRGIDPLVVLALAMIAMGFAVSTTCIRNAFVAESTLRPQWGRFFLLAWCGWGGVFLVLFQNLSK